MPVETYRRNPTFVDMILWDGSEEAFQEILAWAGTNPETGPTFRVRNDRTARIYDIEHHSWIDVLVGQRIVKGPLAEYYSISPEALARSYTLVNRQQPWELVEAICQGCGKRPSELSCYTTTAAMEDISPEQYVYQEEGTYNERNGHFLCDGCYIAAGQPSSSTGWVCP